MYHKSLLYHNLTVMITLWYENGIFKINKKGKKKKEFIRPRAIYHYVQCIFSTKKKEKEKKNYLCKRMYTMYWSSAPIPGGLYMVNRKSKILTFCIKCEWLTSLYFGYLKKHFSDPFNMGNKESWIHGGGTVGDRRKMTTIPYHTTS